MVKFMGCVTMNPCNQLLTGFALGPVQKPGKAQVGDCMMAQESIGKSCGGDGQFYISLEIIPEMTLYFWKTVKLNRRNTDFKVGRFHLQTRSAIYELYDPEQVT